jgi:hypothetical protein
MLPPDYMMNYFTCMQWILERTPDLSERKIAEYQIEPAEAGNAHRALVF